MLPEQEPTIIEGALSELKIVTRWVISGLIQAIFVVFWVLTQWGVNQYIIVPFRVDGIDEITLTIAQWLFAIATLAPIVFFLLREVVTMSVRTYKYICRSLQDEHN